MVHHLNNSTIIDSAAFANCSQLASVVIPEGVTSIGSSAFNSCSQLKNVSLPRTLESVGGTNY